MHRPHFPTINLSLLLLSLHFFPALSAARTFELPVLVQLFVDRYLCDQVLFLWEALLMSIRLLRNSVLLTYHAGSSLNINFFTTLKSLLNQPFISLPHQLSTNPSQSLPHIWLDSFLSVSLVHSLLNYRCHSLQQLFLAAL
jgi:hypothetical protein